MLLLQTPSHPYVFLLVEGTIVGLPNLFGKLHQADFHLTQADRGFAVSTAQVRLIVAFILCIVFVIRNI